MNGTAPTLTPRPPLGLPPGSVRALLSLLICLLFWLLLLHPKESRFEGVKVPPHIYLLLGMVVLFFFSHGKSIATRDHPTPSPLWLPGGTIRLLTAGGTIAVIAWLSINDRERLVERLTPDPAQLAHWSSFLLAGLLGVAAGFVLRPFRYIHSWLSVLSLLIMVAEVLIEVFIYPSIKDKMDMVVWRCAVTGIVASYFGTRT